MTVYSWFRGKTVQQTHVEKIGKLVELIESGVVAGVLPAKSNNFAEAYLMRRPEVTL